MKYYLTRLTSGSNPYNVTGWGKCQDTKVAAQAETGEAAHEITAAQFEILNNTNKPTPQQRGQYRFTYNTTTGAIAAKTLTTQSDRQKALAINKARQLRAEYERYLHPDAKVTTTTRGAVADYLNALDAYITAANWAAAWPALPTITTSSERLLTRIETAFSRAADPATQINSTGTLIDPVKLRMTDFGNLVSNPGFEHGTLGWGTGANWSIASTSARTGDKALVYSATDGVGRALYNQFVFDVQKDRPVFVSAWIKKNAAAVFSSAGIRVNWYDKNGTILPLSQTSLQAGDLTTDIYAQCRVIFDPPAGAVTGLFGVHVYSMTAGSVWFDDVVVAHADGQDRIKDGALNGAALTGELGTGVRLGDQTPANVGAWANDPGARINDVATKIQRRRLAMSDPANIAYGGDFEDTTNICFPLTGAFFSSTNATYVRSGTRCLGIDGAVSTVVSFYDDLEVQPGDKIYVEFWARRNAGWDGTAGNCKFRIANAVGNLHLQSLDFAASSVSDSSHTKRSMTFTVPSGVTRLNFQMMSQSATTGYCYIDDLVVRRVLRSEEIGDGTVTNDKVLAGTLLSDRLSDSDFRNWAWNRANAVGLPAEAAGLPIGGLAEDTNLADGSKVNWDFCGVQRMRHTVTLTYVNGSTLAGSWSFIWHFAEAPHIQVTPRDRSFTPTWNQIAVIRPSARSVSSCTITAYRQAGQTDFVSGDTMTVDVEAIGRWTNTFS